MGRGPRVCAAVAGNPIEHSLTPRLFRIISQYLQKNGHKITFEACEKISNDILVDAMAWGHAKNSAIAKREKGEFHPSREVWLSLTSPLKHQLPIDSGTEWVIGDPMLTSVNQMRYDGHVWRAAETDGAGLILLAEEFGFDFSLRDELEKPLLCMIGGGSTARSCAAAWAAAGGKIWWEKGRRPLSQRGPWQNSLVQTSDVCDYFGRRLHVDFDQSPGEEKEIIGEKMKIELDAPVFLSISYGDGEYEGTIENEWGIHLNGRWFLAAQHLKAWEYLFFPEGSEDLPSLRETMELLKSENLN